MANRKPASPIRLTTKALEAALAAENFIVVIADEQIGAESDPLPPDEQDRIVVAHDEQQHGDHEQVHIGEEPGEAGLTVHVTDGIDVNQRINPGDDQAARRRSGGLRDRPGCGEIAAEDPLIGYNFVSGAGAQDIREDAMTQRKRVPGSPGETMGDLMRVPAAKEPLAMTASKGRPESV